MPTPEKPVKYLDQGSGFTLWWSVFYPPLCSMTASTEMQFSLASSVPFLHVLEGSSPWLWTFSGKFKWLQKAEFPILQQQREKGPRRLPRLTKTIYRWAQTVRILQKSFCFLSGSSKKKRKILYLFLFKLGCKSLKQGFKYNDDEHHHVAQNFLTVSNLKRLRRPSNL